MVKECPIILNNEAVTVVDFNGVHIQFPSIKKNVTTIPVYKENGKYSLEKPADIKIENTEPAITEVAGVSNTENASDTGSKPVAVKKTIKNRVSKESENDE